MKATPGERFDRAEGSSPLRTERAYYDPREIKIQPGWNGRDMTSPESRQWIEALKASIRTDGVRIPIKVRYDKGAGIKTLVAGECRLTACLELVKEGFKPGGELLKVPCERVDGDETELIIENLTSNNSLPLTQWEAGVEYRKLLRFGVSPQDIATRIGKPVRYVNEAIALSNVSLEAKSLLAAGAATPGAVLHAAAGKDGDSVEALKTRVAERPAYPAPKQASLPGTPARTKKKPKPVARPKKPSAKEQIAKKAPSLLELADAMYRLIMDTQIPRSELRLAAEPYGKARGL